MHNTLVITATHAPILWTFGTFFSTSMPQSMDKYYIRICNFSFLQNVLFKLEKFGTSPNESTQFLAIFFTLPPTDEANFAINKRSSLDHPLRRLIRGCGMVPQ